MSRPDRSPSLRTASDREIKKCSAVLYQAMVVTRRQLAAWWLQKHRPTADQLFELAAQIELATQLLETAGARELSDAELDGALLYFSNRNEELNAAFPRPPGVSTTRAQ